MPTTPRLLRRTSPVALVLALALVLLATGCGSSEGEGEAFEGIHRPEPLDVSNVSLTDARDGTAVPVPPAEGELTLVYFGYTSCPDICPTTLSDVRLAMEELGDLADRTTVVFVTADPARDSAEILDRYVGSFVDRYSVVRIEDPAELAAVEAEFQASSSLGAVEEDGTYDVGHTAITYAVDPSGLVQVEWPFGTAPESFAHDLGLLLGQLDQTT